MNNSSLIPTLPDRTTLLAFAVFVFFGGGTSVAIWFTYAELPPFWSGSARIICGAIFFWVVVLIRKLKLPKGRALTGAVLFGVFRMGLPFVFIYWGLVKTPASLYQTIGYIAIFVTILTYILLLYVLNHWTASGSSYSFVLIPLVTVILASTIAGEKITLQFMLGGTLVMLGVWIGALMPAKGK